MPPSFTSRTGAHRGVDHGGQAVSKQPRPPGAPAAADDPLQGRGTRPDRRERPWRATESPFQVDLDTSTPASPSAAAAVAAAHFDATRAIGVEFTEAADAEPEKWRDATLANADLWLTAEEFQRVTEELAAVLTPYRGRTPRRGHPAGSSWSGS